MQERLVGWLKSWSAQTKRFHVNCKTWREAAVAETAEIAGVAAVEVAEVAVLQDRQPSILEVVASSLVPVLAAVSMATPTACPVALQGMATMDVALQGTVTMDGAEAQGVARGG